MEQLSNLWSAARRKENAPVIWSALAAAWFVVLCIVPDPRPLGAPQWSVGALQSLISLSEPSARAVATIALRAAGLGLLGILLAVACSNVRKSYAAPVVLVLAPVLAVISQSINYGYVPIAPQVRLGATSAFVGVLVGLAICRNRVARAALVIVMTALFVWGASTGISDDLDETARATGLHLLANSSDISSGDDGFVQLVELAFTFAEDNSHRSDPVLPNKAAILALGVIVGEERVAQVARRRIDMGHAGEIEAIRNRTTLRGRSDLARHFWVSAALAVLSDEDRSMSVGITKELMDATPGGSGFSFVDLMANRAGILFAQAATRNAASARNMQLLIRRGIGAADYLPETGGLPEGLTREAFHDEYGGLGGQKTARIVDDIRHRLGSCRALDSPRESK